MPTVNRNYSSVARLASLTADVSNSATTASVDVTTGFPTAPFTLVLDPGRAAEEAVTCTAIVGLNLTISRGQDGTPSQPHSAGAQVRHMATARDFREPQEHIAATSGIHGVTGLLMGQTDAEIIDNKTFTPTLSDHVPIILQLASGQSSHMMDFRDASSSLLGYISSAGRLSTTGVDGSSSSTFTAGGATTAALIAKGAAGQTSSILSVRDSTNTEVFGVQPSGTFTSLSVTTLAVSALNAAGRVATLGVDSSSTSTFSTVNTATVPLIVKTPAAGTVAAITVADNEASTVRAGVSSGATSYQLFHGGDATNIVPFRMYGGSLQVTMLSGATSQGATIDYSAFGFTQTPLVYLTIRQDNQSTVQRRVTANVENIPGLTTCGIRAVQTSNEVMPADTLYRVYWLAIQFHPTQAVS